MNKTPYDFGMQKGETKGMEKALRDVAVALLESKFRTVPANIVERIGQLSYTELRTLAVAIPVAESIEGLFPPVR